MSEQSILPSEFVALLAFWFGPPVLIAWGTQLHFFRGRGVLQSHRWRVLVALLATLIGSVLATLAVLALPPSIVPRWLSVIDIRVAGRYLPFLPLSFVSVALFAGVFSLWAIHCARNKA